MSSARFDLFICFYLSLTIESNLESVTLSSQEVVAVLALLFQYAAPTLSQPRTGRPVAGQLPTQRECSPPIQFLKQVFDEAVPFPKEALALPSDFHAKYSSFFKHAFDRLAEKAIKVQMMLPSHSRYRQYTMR